MPNENPDRNRVFHTAAWMWVIYLACLATIDMFIYANRQVGPVLVYHLFNAIPALLFLSLVLSPWFHRHSSGLAPVLILIITLGPVLLTYVFDLHLPPAPLSNLEGMVLRQLPIFLIGLVLVAWNYSLQTILLYSLGTNLFELALVFSSGFWQNIQLDAIVFIIIIRTVCLVVVGITIYQLVRRLRSQQESLREANQQLTHYASTLESLTVSRERNRMSRELHDTVVHTLSGLSVQLETVRAYWEVQPETVRGLLDQSLEATRNGLQETRRAIKALRASPLDDLGLVRALQTLVESAGQRGRLEVETSLPGHDLVLSPDVEQCIYRVAQEAVENAVHHANANHLTLRLETAGKDISLFIQDDGIGFNPESSLPAGHFGLAGMRERSQLAGGELDIQSQPNHGTAIRLVMKGSIG